MSFIPTLQSEAKLSKVYYLDGIYGSLGAHATITDGEAKMFEQGNTTWYVGNETYYDPQFLENNFKETPRGKRHSTFHFMAGSAHTAGWEQLNLMAEDISARLNTQYINLSMIDRLNTSHIGFVDLIIMPEHRNNFRNSFMIKGGDQLLTEANNNLWEVVIKSFYVIADHKDRHGVTPHEIEIDDVMKMNLHDFRPADFMFETGILSYSAKGIEVNDKAYLPDTNIKALDFAIDAMTKLASGRNVTF